MFKTIANAFKVKEIRNKILLTLSLLLIYRLASWVPVPGIDLAVFGDSIRGQDFLSLISSVSGGALAQGSIVALGIAPYITASIVIQLLTIAIPSLEKLTKLGEEGQKKIAFYTKIAALVLAAAQAIGIVSAFSSSLNTTMFGYEAPVLLVGALVATILIAGSMFTYWLGEKITEIGIGNGLSLLIFVGILSTAATSFYAMIVSIVSGGQYANIWEIAIFIVALVLIFGFIVFIDAGERKIPVQYAKQIKGRKMYGGQSTHIPIRVNSTGVMPIIFSMSLLSFPQLLMSIFWPNSSFYKSYSTFLGAGSWIYIVLLGLLILFFSYFWSQVTFKPEDISREIQHNGGFIPGIRPGRPTAEYLKKISNRITLFGAMFLGVIAVIPNLIFKGVSQSGGLVNAFSATGLLIVVSVALELDKQLEAQMLMRNYKGFLK